MDIPRMALDRIANPVVLWLLRSRLHRSLSRHLLVMTLTGRKTGRHVVLPASTIREGDTLVVFSHRDRLWWRNLLQPQTISLRVRDAELIAVGEAFKDETIVAETLRRLGSRSPGRPLNPDELASQAHGRGPLSAPALITGLRSLNQ